MYWLDMADGIAVEDTRPAATTRTYATEGDPGIPLAPTVMPAWPLNMLVNELVYAVQQAGLAPSKTTDTQVYAAMQYSAQHPAGSVNVNSSGYGWLSGGAASMNGGISDDGFEISLGDLEVSAGNLVVTAGSLATGAGIISGTGITATTGNIVASAGGMACSGVVTGGAGVTATLGNVTAPGGQVIAGTGISTTAGNITAAGGAVAAQTGVTSATGDIVATTGNMKANGKHAIVGGGSVAKIVTCTEIDCTPAGSSARETFVVAHTLSGFDHTSAVVVGVLKAGGDFAYVEKISAIDATNLTFTLATPSANLSAVTHTLAFHVYATRS